MKTSGAVISENGILVDYFFEWDALKAELNYRKHGVSFESASEVFRDPAALSMFDAAHSDEEERWITIGQVPELLLVVVIHTAMESANQCTIRIISARKATNGERRKYEGGSHER